MREAFTRCPNCLRLSLSTWGQCQLNDCLTRPKHIVEDLARFQLNLRGYRLAHGHILYVENDDPLEEVIINQHPGSATEAFRLLMAHQWPTTRIILCVDCHENEVPDLGDRCQSCLREFHSEMAAGEVV